MTPWLTFRQKTRLHGWCAVGYAGFYCGGIVPKSMSSTGVLAAWGLAVLGVLMTLATVREFYGFDLSSGVERYVEEVYGGDRGGTSAAATIVSAWMALGLAGMYGGDRGPDGVALTEGLRNAAYLAVMLYAWRMKRWWCWGCIAAWALGDIWVLWRMGGKVGEQTGSFTMLTTIVAGGACLKLQDAVERWLGGQEAS